MIAGSFGLPALRLNPILGITALFFTGLAAWPWLVPPVPAVPPLIAGPTAAPAPALAALPPLASYAAIVERPLFSPSRRPVPGAEPVAVSSTMSRYRLLGIIGSGPRKSAFVADGARRIEIDAGGTLDGWTVKEIGQDSITLTSPTGDAVLKLIQGPPEAAKPQ